jgi:hypothetical protein
LVSAHVVPLVTVGFEHTPDVQTSLVQGLPSAQLAAVLHDWQPPIGVFVHPLMGLQASVVHASLSLQLRAVPAVQVPLWHVSAPLQTLPSVHDVPLATLLAVHPVAGLQLSVVQGLPSLHVSGVPAVQAPLWHVSAPLQRLPSGHAVPLVTLLWVHPVLALQPSVVQAFESLQLSGVPAVHTPVWQVSSPLQTVASAQDEPLATLVFWQPVAGTQLSVVHTLLSLQLSGVPAVQVPL